MIQFECNLEIVSPNRTDHWTKINRINKKNAALIKKCWLAYRCKTKPPCTVTIERIYDTSKQKKLDHSNYIAACKGIEDSIAAFLCPDDVVIYKRKGKTIRNPGHCDKEANGITFVHVQTPSNRSTVKIKITC